jgi:acetyl esterase
MTTAPPTEDVLAEADGPAVRLRIYRSRTRNPSPFLLWMHGGGFIGGDLDMPESHAVCAALAEHGITCASVDYRLAWISST